MAQKFRKIGVLTSGGDAPGMNAAVRAVTRAALARGVEVMGIIGGYRGLIHDELIPLTSGDVSNKIQLSGTFLYSDRCLEFKEEAGMQKAIATLKKHEIDGVIAIGGDGTFRGATDLSARGIPTIGIPGTIDNDITASDNTIGFNTAMQSVIENVDRLRDTCESHARCNVVEVMGRGAGDITINTAIATGAVDCVIPECPFDEDACVEKIIRLRRAGKRSFLIIVSEAFPELGEALAKRISSTTKELAEKEGNDRLWVESKFCRFAHLVRGGTPTLSDRLLATKMGVYAVDELLAGKSDLIVIEQNGELTSMNIAYSQVLDRMYKGTLKEGMLDKFSAEQIADMEAFIAAKKETFAKTYAMFEEITG
ncbi:MAG: ATP-dependent 6-phosphofructokinase [Ruminococcaceae bacterium]|nr:ATP-dependent 6-phosphofructokinase [Oscillospiraceae bacterium]